MHPSVAQYNGFYTLDSYQNNYRLEYKHEFRNIIASELDKNEELRIYFDYWGSRCNVFSSELRKTYDLMCAKEYNAYVNNLSIDTEALRKMGGEYILSAVIIGNYKELNLKFLKKFSDKNSMWDIYLYKL